MEKYINHADTDKAITYCQKDVLSKVMKSKSQKIQIISGFVNLIMFLYFLAWNG